MTIKEFAQLCACNTQTLRYYDKIDLLKPVHVDPWSGYRHYEPAQALDFVKIKNLQAADFTIEQIKLMLTQSDQQVYEAFALKITQQEQKLERIREIQKIYLCEKHTMEQIIYSMTDYILSQCNHPEVLTEFGLEASQASAILALLKEYMNDVLLEDLPPEGIRMTVNDEVIQGESAILDRIHSFTRENLSDTILLNTGPGYSAESSADPAPEFKDYDIIFEKQGWTHIREFFDAIPSLEKGRVYCLWVQTSHMAYSEDPSFAMFLMGSVLYRQGLRDVTLNCSCSTVAGQGNHFRLLCKRANQTPGPQTEI